METKILTGNKTIAIFDGWNFIENCIHTHDLYESGDNFGKNYTVNIWVKNPTAEFLKLKIIGENVAMDYYDDIEPFNDFAYENNLKYHISWDWLMPIVNKIYYMKISSLNEKEQQVRLELIDNIKYSLTNPIQLYIENVWLNVVYFIEWYNTINLK